MIKPKLFEPKDLGVKIGSKKEAFLTTVIQKLQEEIESSELANELNKMLIPHIKKEIEKEKETFK